MAPESSLSKVFRKYVVCSQLLVEWLLDNMTTLIRNFCVGDEIDLSRVFQSSIRELASADYTIEQIEVWAGASFDLEKWVKRIRELKPFVV